MGMQAYDGSHTYTVGVFAHDGKIIAYTSCSSVGPYGGPNADVELDLASEGFPDFLRHHYDVSGNSWEPNLKEALQVARQEVNNK